MQMIACDGGFSISNSDVVGDSGVRGNPDISDEINQKYESIKRLQDLRKMPDGPNCIGFALYAVGMMPYCRYIEPDNEFKAMITPDSIVPLHLHGEYLNTPGTLIVLFNNKVKTELNHVGVIAVNELMNTMVVDKPGPSADEYVQKIPLEKFIENGVKDSVYKTIQFTDSFIQPTAGKYAILLKPNCLKVSECPNDKVSNIEGLLRNLQDREPYHVDSYLAIMNACKNDITTITDPRTHSLVSEVQGLMKYPSYRESQCLSLRNSVGVTQERKIALLKEVQACRSLNIALEQDNGLSDFKKAMAKLVGYRVPMYAGIDQPARGAPVNPQKLLLKKIA